jgi:hypothetical protein
MSMRHRVKMINHPEQVSAGNTTEQRIAGSHRFRGTPPIRNLVLGMAGMIG